MATGCGTGLSTFRFSSRRNFRPGLPKHFHTEPLVIRGSSSDRRRLVVKTPRLHDQVLEGAPCISVLVHRAEQSRTDDTGEKNPQSNHSIVEYLQPSGGTCHSEPHRLVSGIENRTGCRGSRLQFGSTKAL